MVQSKAAGIVTGAFKATSTPALDIEAYLMPMKQQLDQLAKESAMRVAESTIYESMINLRSKRKNQAQSPLEKTTARLVKDGIYMKKLEKKIHFAVSPWWQPPLINILSTKELALKSHEIITQQQTAHKAEFYTDGSGINGKIGASVVLSSMGQTFKVYLGTDRVFTVYAGELVGIWLALTTARDHLWSKITIVNFTDNQAAIRAIQNPTKHPGQNILVMIFSVLDELRAQGKGIQLHEWIPAHKEVAENEKADIAAKMATGWRKKEQRKCKVCGSGHQIHCPACFNPLAPLRQQPGCKAGCTERMGSRVEGRRKN